MDDPALTSQAIAELMREFPSNNGKASYEPQERKINPLGKPNKKFLGRTINNALWHNKRAIERTQASCQQKLQELDDRYERRKTNAFYSRNKKEESYGKRERKSRSRKKLKKRHKSRSSSSESRSRSRSHKKKHKKKHSKFKRRQRRRRSTSSSSSSEAALPAKTADELTVPRPEYYVHSNNLALAMAMAYSQTLFAHQTPANKPHSPASPSSDIIRELMSDEEAIKQEIQSDTLSIATSSEEVPEIVTIDVSSLDERSVGSSGTDNESDASSCSSIALVDSGSDELSSNSDIEIIECDTEPKEEQNQLPMESTQKAEPEEALSAPATTVDLTDD